MSLKQQHKSFIFLKFKKIVSSIIIGFVLIFMCVKGLEWWIETNFQSTLNADPKRAYNITYKELDLSTFFNGIQLENVEVIPLDLHNQTSINAILNNAHLEGLNLYGLLFEKRLSINSITFIQPKFKISLSPDRVQKESRRSIQSMFSDVLTRVDITNFNLIDGSVLLSESNSNSTIGSISNINIKASKINTNSLKFSNIIPFEMDNLTISFDSLHFSLNEFSNIHVSHFHYQLKEKEASLKGISFENSLDWLKVSQDIPYQKDIMQFGAKEISIHQFETSSEFYSHLDLVAQKVSIDQFDLQIGKNKNRPPPPIKIKPTFQEMLKLIPFKMKVDTINILNSSLAYSELGAGKNQYGTIDIQKMNGFVYGVTNMLEKQNNFEQMFAELKGKLMGQADIGFKLNIPYQSNNFSATIEAKAIELSKLNNIIEPLVHLEIDSGKANRIHYTMNYNGY
ncbi:hypothetical protein [Psychroflexus salis]|nr:hypothetical protein [Psychroflexus salis]